LHTVVFGPFGVSIEVQIRPTTCIAWPRPVSLAWLYKTGDSTDSMRQHALQWLKDLLDTQQKAGNPHDPRAPQGRSVS